MKTAWAVVISFVIIAVVVGGGTYYFVHEQGTKEKNFLQTQINDLSTKLATTEKSLADAQAAATLKAETADWETYTNTAVGFALKYPTSWKVMDDSKGNISITNKNKIYEMEGSSLDPIVVQYLKDTSGTSIDNYLSGANATLKPLFKNPIKIDGETAYVIQGSTPPTYHDSRIIFFNGYAITFSSNGEEVKDQDTGGVIPATFAKIIKTIKFVHIIPN